MSCGSNDDDYEATSGDGDDDLDVFLAPFVSLERYFWLLSSR